MMSAHEASGFGFTGLARWMKQAEVHWKKHKTPGSESNIAERLDFQSNLTRQRPQQGYKVVHNASGSHIAAAVVDASNVRQVSELPVNGLIVDAKAWHVDVDDRAEAHYLVAFLNSTFVNEAIKPHQTMGQFGASTGKGHRDIHRRPYEVVPIPAFDSSNPDHIQLAAVSERAHETIAKLRLPPNSRIGTIRKEVRRALRTEIQQIEAAVERILGNPARTSVEAKPRPSRATGHQHNLW